MTPPAAPPRQPHTKLVQDLRVGDRFSWIPDAWYGPCRLISITKYCGYEATNRWNLRFDAKVVNPPGVIYGVKGATRVRMLAPAPPRRRRKAKV